MTENKRYTSSEDIGCLDVHCSNIHDKGEFIGTAILSDVEQLCDLLNEQDARINELEKENEQLKKENKELENEIEKLENRLWNCQNVR